MSVLVEIPVFRDAGIGLGVWLVFRLLGAQFSLREVLVAAVLIGVVHLGDSGVLRHGVTGPYIAQFGDLCTEYADPDRCDCARAHLERRLRDDEFARVAFKFYVDRMPPPELRVALADCH